MSDKLVPRSFASNMASFCLPRTGIGRYVRLLADSYDESHDGRYITVKMTVLTDNAKEIPVTVLITGDHPPQGTISIREGGASWEFACSYHGEEEWTIRPL